MSLAKGSVSSVYLFKPDNLYTVFRTSYKLFLVTKDQTLVLGQVLGTNVIQMLVSDLSYTD